MTKLVVLGLLLLQLGLNQAQLENGQLFFSLTYRDFLPARCMFDIGEPTIEDVWRSAWDTNNNGAVNNPSRTASCEVLQSTAADNIFRNALKSEVIAGHPDFEARGEITDSRDCVDPDDDPNNFDFPRGACILATETLFSTIGRNLVTGSNGIPKPEYCRDNEGGESRCGFTRDDLSEQTQTQKKFFDTWYNDDIKFNRRLGQRIALRDVTPSNSPTETSRVFEFDSASDDPAPDENRGDFTAGFFGPFDRFLGLARDEFDNVRDFPVWPQSQNNLNRKFWFTSELHSTFQYERDGDMKFTFSGDDDFWAFIDGQMVVDVGGLHSTRKMDVDLNREFSAGSGNFKVADFLGLVDGDVYTLDLFHAERQTGQSNFFMTTTLAPACNVQQAASVRFDFGVEVDSEEFVTRGIDNFGNNNQFDLVREGVIGQANSVFSKNVLNLEKGFVVSFTVDTTGPSEGFAFVVQAEGVEDISSTAGNTFNVEIRNSFAVVFDLCVDREENAECQERNVRLHFPNNFNNKNSAFGATQRVFDDMVLRSLDRSGERMKVEIIYFGGNPDFLEVYIDNSLYLRQDEFFLDQVIGSFGAHVGLTASTGGITGGLNIEDFKVQSVDRVAAATSELFDRNDLVQETIPADGTNSTDGLSFQTKDFCGDNVNAGGLAQEFDVIFVEQLNENNTFFNESRTPSVIRNINAEDNGDGTYTIRLSTTSPGIYSQFVSFGGPECSLQTSTSNQNGFQIVDVVFPSSNLDCFTSEVEDQFLVLPLDEFNDQIGVDFDEGNNFDFVPVAAAGGGLFVLSLLGLVLFVHYRNKWKRERNLIEGGRDLRMEQALNLTGGDEYTETGKKILAQQQEISQLRNKAAAVDKTSEIKALTQDNQNLKELIKSGKQNVEAAAAPATSSAKNSKKNKYKKNDF